MTEEKPAVRKPVLAQPAAPRRKSTRAESLLGWIVLLLAVIAIAAVITASAAVMTAVNTRELCQDQDELAYLGSSCSW